MTVLLLEGRAEDGDAGAPMFARCGGGVANDSEEVGAKGEESMMATTAVEELQLSCKKPRPKYYPVLKSKDDASIITK